MAEKTEITTEGDFVANFNPTIEAVDNAYFKAYDVLATVNGLIYIVTAVVIAIVSFLVFFNVNRLQTSQGISLYLLGLPLVFVGLVTVLFSGFIVYYWSRQKHVLMTRVIPFFLLLLVGVAVLVSQLESPDIQDQWTINPVSAPEDKAEAATTYTAVALAGVSLVVCWLNSKLRTDRLHFLGTGFMSFVVCAFAVCYLTMYLASYVMAKIEESDPNPDYKFPLYVLGAVVAYSCILISDGIAVQITNAITGFGRRGDYRASAPELANATSRSRQMVMATFFILIFLTMMLIYWFKPSLVENVNETVTSTLPIVLVSLLTLPILTIAGVGAMEIRMGAPSIYYMLSNVMIGFVFFVVGTQFIPWNEFTLAVAGITLFFVALLWLLMGNIGSNLSIVALIGFTFMLVKFAGKLVIEQLGDDASDGEKLALLGVPLLVFTGIWFYRSYIGGDSYSVPFTLMVFSFIYILNFFDESVATEQDYVARGESRWTNLGLDFVLATSVLMAVTSVGAFSESQVDFVQEQTATQDATAVNTIIKFALNTVIGYVGAWGYNKLQTDTQVDDYLAEAQRNANRVAETLRQDLKLTGLKDL